MSSNDVHIIEGIEEFPILNIDNVSGYGIIYQGKMFIFVFAADIAREGGLVFEEEKTYIPTSGNVNHEDFSDTSVRKTYVYETIIWNRFNKYLNNAIEIAKQYNSDVLSWLQLPIHPYSYIPIELAIMVIIQCKSQKARHFQWLLTDHIMPTIRDNILNMKQQQISQQQSQIDYYQDMLDTDQLYSTTEIAHEFEMSAQQLRRILQDHQIIYPCNKTWQISQALVHYDYVRNKYNTNVPDHPYWTNYGRRFVIDLLTKYGYTLHDNNPKLIVPLIFDDHNI